MRGRISPGLACTLAMVVWGLFASSTEAAVITYTTRASFDAAAGPTALETFNTIPTETRFHTVPLDVGDFTLSMIGNVNTRRNYIDLVPHQFSQFNIDGSANANVFTDSGESLFLTFDVPIKAFGSDLGNLNDDLIRTHIVADGNVLVPPLADGDTPRFFGLVSDTEFMTVEFRGVRNDGFSIDNVSYSRIPEPCSIALLGIGFTGMLFVSLRRDR